MAASAARVPNLLFDHKTGNFRVDNSLDANLKGIGRIPDATSNTLTEMQDSLASISAPIPQDNIGLNSTLDQSLAAPTV